MPRKCSICIHPKAAAIDSVLATGDASFRRIAADFSVSESALRRHKTNHLPAHLAKAADAAEAVRATDIMGELQRCFQRVNLLFDACDRWLRDADDPEQYDIGPRAEDLKVTYWEDGPQGRPVKRKARLSTLLERSGVGKGSGLGFEMVETKSADPRELILKTANRLQSQIELLAKLLGELDDRPQVNLLLNPQWLTTRTVILDALAPFPDARTAAAAALLEVENVPGH